MAPAELCGRLVDLGVRAVVLDATIDEAYACELSRELDRRRGELPVVALEAPCPRPRGPRPPRLATEDREERRAALAAMDATLRLAADLGGRLILVRLGGLDVKQDWTRLTRAFARRERIGSEWLLAERAQLSPLALDLARFGLEPVLERAAAAGVTIGLLNRARWFEIPDDLETRALMDDFQGAPIAPALDAAAAHARECLGMGRVADWLALHGKQAAGALLADACGLRGGLPWGRGEVDHAAVLGGIAETALRIAHCAPGATDDELRDSMAAATGR
jgi:hypothetical protein